MSSIHLWYSSKLKAINVAQSNPNNDHSLKSQNNDITKCLLSPNQSLIKAKHLKRYMREQH